MAMGRFDVIKHTGVTRWWTARGCSNSLDGPRAYNVFVVSNKNQLVDRAHFDRTLQSRDGARPCAMRSSWTWRRRSSIEG